MEAALQGGRWSRGRGAFTIMELMMSVLVIALIISLLMVSMRYFFAAGQSAKQRGAVTSMKQAVADFQTKFGFVPPLVRDQYRPNPGVVNHAGRGSTTAVSGENRIVVVSDADLALIPGTVADNVYADARYSVRTLPYYLVGALDLDLRAGGSPECPIDGVLGPGSYSPERDGSFRIPAEMKRDVLSGNPPRKLMAEVYKPFIDAGSSDPKLVRGADSAAVDGNDIDPKVMLQLRDAKNVAYRYYRWVKLDPALNPTAVNQNIPLLVGSASDASVRGASYAIVGSGPNQVFGDEDITTVRSRLGRPLNYSEAKAREEAASDNIVEVGQ
jgi:type II secretory pathway pseudopilin PulG